MFYFFSDNLILLGLAHFDLKVRLPLDFSACRICRNRNSKQVRHFSQKYKSKISKNFGLKT